MPSAERRSLILESAATLFAEKGIKATTVRGIAERVGILSGSLYHYFDSKDDILRTIIEEYLQQLCDRYSSEVLPEADARSQVRDLVLASLAVVYEHPHASEIYQANRTYFEGDDRFEVIRRLAAGVHETWLGVVESGVESKVFRSDVNPRVFHRFLRDAVFLASRWHRPDDAYGIEDLAEDTTRIFLEGFTAEAARH